MIVQWLLMVPSQLEEVAHHEVEEDRRYPSVPYGTAESPVRCEYGFQYFVDLLVKKTSFLQILIDEFQKTFQTSTCLDNFPRVSVSPMSQFLIKV